MPELPSSMQIAHIDAFNEYAGDLIQPAQYSFSYQSASPYWCSLTMPVRGTPYQYGDLHPVFAQNLPEGYVRRYISERLERYAKVNDLYLLALQQDHGIGHIGVRSEMPRIAREQVSLDDILTWNASEPIFPQLLERFYLRGMLSGMQPKVMVPITGRATVTQQDLIVKSFDDEFDQLTVNEFVCMSAAAEAGLCPPRFWLSQDQRSFIIERFDRPNGERVGFEDFTVLTGKRKYEGSYETLLKAVMDYTRTAEEVEKAYRLIVFNCMIGNGDAHLKNFALLYSSDRRRIALAPPYDITHNLIYPTIERKLALKIGGARTFPNRQTLIKLGRLFKVRHAQSILEEMADTLSDFIEQFEEIKLVTGLKQSIQKSLSTANVRGHIAIRRDRIKKHE